MGEEGGREAGDEEGGRKAGQKEEQIQPGS